MKSNLKNFFLLPAYTLLMQLCLLGSPLGQKTQTPVVSEHNKATTKSYLCNHKSEDCDGTSVTMQTGFSSSIFNHLYLLEILLLAVQSGIFYGCLKKQTQQSAFILKKSSHDKKQSSTSGQKNFARFYFQIQKSFIQIQNHFCISYIHFSSQLD